MMTASGKLRGATAAPSISGNATKEFEERRNPGHKPGRRDSHRSEDCSEVLRASSELRVSMRSEAEANHQAQGQKGPSSCAISANKAVIFALVMTRVRSTADGVSQLGRGRGSWNAPPAVRCYAPYRQPVSLKSDARRNLDICRSLCVAQRSTHRMDAHPFERKVVMVHVSLLVTLQAKAGKEAEVAKFLESGLALANEEPRTTVWFALRMGSSTFGIFDAFSDEAGREAHLKGPIAAALMAKASDLLSEPPKIEKVDVLAAKLPR